MRGWSVGRRIQREKIILNTSKIPKLNFRILDLFYYSFSAPPLPNELHRKKFDSNKMHVKRMNWEKIDSVEENTIWAQVSEVLSIWYGLNVEGSIHTLCVNRPERSKKKKELYFGCG